MDAMIIDIVIVGTAIMMKVNYDVLANLSF